jgi:hypothetical protein
MEQLLSALLLGLIISYSFSTKKNNGVEKETSNYPSADKSVRKQSQTSNKSAAIPAEGQYRFDIALAEWEGKSMGEKVSIVIKGDRTEAGEVPTLGILKTYKSGKWIIPKSEADCQIEEISGCTGGPSVIDFKKMKFWMC